MMSNDSRLVVEFGIQIYGQLSKQQLDEDKSSRVMFERRDG